MQLPTLDFTPLKTIKPMPGSSLMNIPPHQRFVFAGLLAFVGIVLLVSDNGVLFAVVFIPVALLISFWAWNLVQWQRARDAQVIAFADRNHLQLQTRVADPTYQGLMFQVGFDRELVESLTIPTNTTPVEIGNYQYTVGDRKHQTTRYVGFMRLKLPRQLPNMVLDARANNITSFFSNLPESFDRKQVLQLEGDFNNYFTLYAPKQYERDALYVFTPDVMATLVDYAKQYDIEIIGDDLFVYATKRLDLSNPELLQAMLGLAAKLDPELRAQTDYYADEKVGNRAMNQVAPAGKHLKRRINWFVALAIVGYILFNVGHGLLGVANATAANYVYLGGVVIFWGGVMWFAWHYTQRNKR